MGRKSSVTLLPPEVRAALDGKLATGRFTIDDLVADMEESGFEISRSALGRYAKNFNDVAQRLRQSREMADVLVQEIGPAAAEGKTGRLLAELLQSFVFNQLIATGEDDKFDPQEFHFLARTIKDLASAQKIEADRELKIRQETVKAAAKKAETAVKAAGREHGFTLPPEALRTIREQIYGIVERPA